MRGSLQYPQGQQRQQSHSPPRSPNASHRPSARQSASSLPPDDHPSTVAALAAAAASRVTQPHFISPSPPSNATQEQHRPGPRQLLHYIFRLELLGKSLLISSIIWGATSLLPFPYSTLYISCIVVYFAFLLEEYRATSRAIDTTQRDPSNLHIKDKITFYESISETDMPKGLVRSNSGLLPIPTASYISSSSSSLNTPIVTYPVLHENAQSRRKPAAQPPLPVYDDVRSGDSPTIKRRGNTWSYTEAGENIPSTPTDPPVHLAVPDVPDREVRTHHRSRSSAGPFGPDTARAGSIGAAHHLLHSPRSYSSPSLVPDADPDRLPHPPPPMLVPPSAIIPAPISPHTQQTVKEMTMNELSELEKEKKVKSTLVLLKKQYPSYIEEKLDWSQYPANLPTPRASHTAVLYGGSTLVLIGGDGGDPACELHFFDADKMIWGTPKVTGAKSAPGSIYGHDCCKIGNRIYIFGGYMDNQLSNRMLIVCVIDDGTVHWSQPRVSGTVPTPRVGHTLTRYNTRFILWAGFDGRSWLNDLYMLDTATMTWTQPEVSGTPPPERCGHSATVVGDRLFIFGGNNCQKEFNDLYILQLDTMAWICVTPMGDIPPERTCHATTRVGKNLFVVGGRREGVVLKDVWLLSDKLYWARIGGVQPTPHVNHTLTRSGSKLFIMGGRGANGQTSDDIWVVNTVVLPISVSSNTMPIIDYSDIKLEKEIGTGNFSKVIRGTWKQREVAVKKLLRRRDKDDLLQEFKSEVELLSTLRHPNMVACLGYSTSPMCIVMEFLPSSLFDFIHNYSHNPSSSSSSSFSSSSSSSTSTTTSSTPSASPATPRTQPPTEGFVVPLPAPALYLDPYASDNDDLSSLPSSSSDEEDGYMSDEDPVQPSSPTLSFLKEVTQINGETRMKAVARSREGEFEYDEDDEDDYLRDAHIVTEEELMKRKKDKMRKLLATYKIQFSRLKDKLNARWLRYQRDLAAEKRIPLKTTKMDDESGKRKSAQTDPTATGEKANKRSKKLPVEPPVTKCAVENCSAHTLVPSAYCFAHVLRDPAQKLFRGCSFVYPPLPVSAVAPMPAPLKPSAPPGAVTVATPVPTRVSQCGYPILLAQKPPLCAAHLESMAMSNPHLLAGSYGASVAAKSAAPLVIPLNAFPSATSLAPALRLHVQPVAKSPAMIAVANAANMAKPAAPVAKPYASTPHSYTPPSPSPSPSPTSPPPHVLHICSFNNFRVFVLVLQCGYL
eukprot:TRINITY_DN163_c0_g1_i2.p1 TRINITY_DN163_c0_g1~~TRINITY_DN163_c0_g1_i2.p1  ORF type:complete len:1231 (+),score=312.63 TRINITY_DN163_c0_g1_i2:99-3791(+)